MAVNVDTVYKTVLSILNKEQRGYVTPSEFNKVASQVQLEIFNEYFDNLSLLNKLTQPDIDYADKINLLDQKLAIFKKNATVTGTYPSGVVTVPTDVRELGTVVYTNGSNNVELQRIQRSELYNLNNSDYTKPSVNYPIYLYEKGTLIVYPDTIISGISLNYLRKPVDPIWGFTVGTRGQYIYNSSTYSAGPPATGSRDFELHESEQTTIILRVLMYSGVIIQNPQIVQMAAQQVQADQINSKS